MATLTLTLLLACTMAVHSYVRVCYYTNWSQYRHGAGNYFLERDYQDGLCTHIIFSFGKVEKSGEGYVIKPYEWNDQSRLYIEVRQCFFYPNDSIFSATFWYFKHRYYKFDT